MKEKELKEENNNNEVIKDEKKKVNFLKKKEIWISGIVGLVIGGLLIYLLGILGVPGLGNETIAKFKGGKIDQNDLYKEMKKYYPVSYVLEIVDDSILKEKYELTDEQKSEINTEVDSILNTYKTYYGYTEEAFLEENGFESKEDFINYLQLDYRRNLYCIDYFKTLIPTEDIQNYYDENVYGEINTKHMLVNVSEDVKDEEALKLANEIIAKLDDGASFDDVANEYKDKITTENVDFDSFNSNLLAEEYAEASKELDKDTYTKTPVKTDFGYHVIYVIDKKDKPSLEEVENDIVETLGKDLEAEDKYIRYKALIKLREEYNLKFNDKKFKEEYEEYCEQVNSVSSTTAVE